MAWLHYGNVGIAAMSGVVPEFVQEINTDPNHPQAEYIKGFMRQTGVRRRHISITEQTSTDLGFAAVNLALERAGWTAQDLDALVFVGQTPDFNPGTGNAYVLHNHLGMRDDAFVMDLAQGCAGFPFGLSLCGGLLAQPNIRRMALVSGDTMWPYDCSRSSLINSPYFLSGEGSVALVLESKDNCPVDLGLFSDGSGYHYLYNPACGVRHAWRKKAGVLPNGEIYKGGAYMDGMEITSFSTMRVVDSMKEFLLHYDRTIDDYDGVVLHQANMQIIKAMARRLKVPKGKFPTTIEKLANTNVASAPLTIVDAYGGQSGKKRLLVCAFGIGLSWGVADFSVDAEVIVPLATSSARFDEDFLKPLP